MAMPLRRALKGVLYAYGFGGEAGGSYNFSNLHGHAPTLHVPATGISRPDFHSICWIKTKISESFEELGDLVLTLRFCEHIIRRSMKTTKRRFTLITLLSTAALISLYLAYLLAFANDKRYPSFEYVVEQNDTCLDIAYNTGTSIESVIEANNLEFDCSDIYPGQKLNIPYPTSTSLSAAEATRIFVECDKVLYIVEEGDSISSISRNYNVPQRAIKQFSGLENDILTPGTEILIPLCIRASTCNAPTPIATLTIP